MSTEKLVSVVMAVYNTPEEYLRGAIASILNQTYANFEFIIVDDCSGEETRAILREYAERDGRVRLLFNTENCGLAKNLNRGIREAKGEYIARMDSDDLSMPTRFEKQAKFLDSHPGVDVLGTNCLLLKDGTLSKPRTFENEPWQIQGRLLFGCQGILHPSIMMRRTLFAEEGLWYDEEFRIAQDFELWTRVGLRHKIYVLNEALFHYRISEVQVSTAKRDKQVEFRTRVLLRELGYLGIEPTDEEKTLHVQLAHGKQCRSPRALFDWCERLLDANREKELYDPVSFEYYLRKRQLDSALHILTHKGPSPANVAGVLRAARLASASKRAFQRKSVSSGSNYRDAMRGKREA